MKNWEAYGPPAIHVGALKIWVHGYQFPESTDAWDGNWLRVTAHCAASGASVVVTGAILDTVTFSGSTVNLLWSTADWRVRRRLNLTSRS
jgi:hypothetical protein